MTKRYLANRKRAECNGGVNCDLLNGRRGLVEVLRDLSLTKGLVHREELIIYSEDSDETTVGLFRRDTYARFTEERGEAPMLLVAKSDLLIEDVNGATAEAHQEPSL